MSSGPKWSSEGADAAQLFLDFHSRKHDPHNYRPAEIHEQPDRPYSKYVKKNFIRNAETVAKKVIHWEEFATGLSPAFKKKVGLTEEGEAEEEDLPEKVTQMTLEEKKPGTNQATKEKKSMKKGSCHDPINVVYPGKDRIFLMFPLVGERHVEEVVGNTRIEIGDDRKSVKYYTRVSEVLLNAKKIIGGVGLIDPSNPERDANILVLDAFLKKRNESLKKEEDGNIWELYSEVKLDFPVEPFFVDQNGKPMENVYIDTNQEEMAWAFFWLKGSHTVKKKKQGSGSLVGYAKQAALKIETSTVYTWQTVEDTPLPTPTEASTNLPQPSFEGIPMNVDNMELNAKKRAVASTSVASTVVASN